jgi:RNA polymerase sigma-70 factor (ECF subfamily)
MAEERYSGEPATGRSPEQVFERRWAMTVLDRAMGRLQRKIDSSGDEISLEHLKQYLTSAEPQVPYRETAETLGVSCENTDPAGLA